MIVSEPCKAAIWHCLNHYAYQDAIFLAERLCTEVESEESLFLLATCYYRSGQVHQAHWLLTNKGAKSPECRFLLAKCAYELKEFGSAENALSNDNHLQSKSLDKIITEFGETASFALQLIAKSCQQTERADLATEANLRAVKMNPFLFQTFIDLCNRGEKPEPNEIFQVSQDTFQLSQATPNLNAVYFNSGDTTVDLQQHNIGNLSTPIDQQQQHLHHFTPPPPLPQRTPAQQMTTDDETPPCSGENAQLFDVQTPFRKQFKYLTAFSPNSPSFGVLPIMQTPANVDLNAGIVTEHTLEKSSKKIKSSSGVGGGGGLGYHHAMQGIGGTIGGVGGGVVINTLKEQSPKQQPFGPTGNITPKTPSALTGQNVRRSSRLFSNSVKENSKSPHINKFAAPRSPPRKTKQRSKINLSNTISYELNEKQEKEKDDHTITETEKVLINNSINSAQNLAQQVQQMQRQSAEGLMALMRDLGRGYLHLTQYECKEAIQCFTSVPPQHFNSSWVQSMIALAYHEQREYEEAVKIFQEIHDREPHRLEMMEIYSTDLWHLQKDVMMSALAQDLIAQDKESPITWCVAGNCFSAHKEHETAIKFLQRAIQVDPNFAYSYTLLGHELVLTEELEKALACFRTAILKNPRQYNAWFGIGTIYSKQERYQLAEIHYRKALQINPKNSVVMVHIGVMQFFLHKVEDALQTFNGAIAVDPKNPLCKFHRGSMYFSMGKYQDALRELEELKQIVPKESVVFYLIGKIHKKLGNVDSALMHFSWATDLDPKGANNQIKDNFDSIIRTQNENMPGDTPANGTDPQSDQSEDRVIAESSISGNPPSYYDSESP